MTSCTPFYFSFLCFHSPTFPSYHSSQSCLLSPRLPCSLSLSSAKPVLSSLSPWWAASPSPQSLPCFSLLPCTKPVSFPFCQPSPDSRSSLALLLSSLSPLPLSFVLPTWPVFSSPTSHDFIVLCQPYPLSLFPVPLLTIIIFSPSKNPFILLAYFLFPLSPRLPSSPFFPLWASFFCSATCLSLLPPFFFSGSQQWAPC